MQPLDLNAYGRCLIDWASVHEKRYSRFKPGMKTSEPHLEVREPRQAMIIIFPISLDLLLATQILFSKVATTPRSRQVVREYRRSTH